MTNHQPITLNFNVTITLPAEADEATLHTMVQNFMVDFAAELIRCASTWQPPRPPRGGGKISTG